MGGGGRVGGVWVVGVGWVGVGVVVWGWWGGW